MAVEHNLWANSETQWTLSNCLLSRWFATVCAEEDYLLAQKRTKLKTRSAALPTESTVCLKILCEYTHHMTHNPHA